MKKITTVLILLSMFLTGCFNNKLNVILKEPIIIEYGSNEKDVQFFDSKKSDKNVMVKEIKGLDTKKIGEQVIHVTFADGKKEIEQEIKVQVKDTKIPVINLLMEKLTITVGDKLDLSKAVKNVSDPVDGKLKYSEKEIAKDGYYFVTDKVDTKKAGTYKAQVIASDKNGNKTSKEIEIVVKNKPKKEVDLSEKVSVNTEYVEQGNVSQDQVQQGQQNSVHNPNRKPTTKPTYPNQYPTEIIVPDLKPIDKNHVHDFNPTGHTDAVLVGPVFDNDDDCMAFADNYSNPEWAGFGYSTCQCSCGRWRTYCFNISYWEN